MADVVGHGRRERAAALLIFPGAYYFGPIYFERERVPHLLLLGVLVGFPYLIIGAYLGLFWIVRRNFRPAVRWIIERRDPTEAERHW